MSKPRPIHVTRPLRSAPDEAEPSFSFEEESFLSNRAVDYEDDFHRRLTSSGARREESGNNSFWRASSSGATSASASPSFSSVNLRGKSDVNTKERKSNVVHAHTPPQTVANISSSESIIKNAWPDRRDSGLSATSSTSQKHKKDVTRQRAADRRLKLDAQGSNLDAGHIVDSEANFPFQLPNFAEMGHSTSLDRSSSDQSTGSLLYGKTPSGALIGKSSSLIFPTGLNNSNDNDSEAAKAKRRRINLALDQCEAVRFPFKKKLILTNLDLSSADIPLKDLCGTSLGNTLYKLSLSGNRLGTVPPRLVQNLPVLKHLDLSQCELSQLPEKWNLPKLSHLNLSHNGFTEFPDETMLAGLPELQDLNMYANKVAEIIIPTSPKLLSRLEKLDLGYNDLVSLPPELDQLKSLKVLRVMNNFLAKVPMRVCEMDLKSIDVSSNPITEPPAETCERGICSMRRYWHCIRMEEQSKQKAVEEASKKVQRQSKKRETKKKYGGLGLMFQGKSKGKCSENEASSQSPISTSVIHKEIDSPISPQLMKHGSLPKSIVESSSEMNTDCLDAKATLAETSRVHSISLDAPTEELEEYDRVTVNDTLKVIFVGMAMVGKTSMIKRLIEGTDAVVPTRDERTVGVDIYQWNPKDDSRFEHIDSRIEFQDQDLSRTCGDVDVKFSVWDFAGQHVYHATHELFFSSRALYVLVWDMGVSNPATQKSEKTRNESGAFSLYDSDEEDDEDDLRAEEEARRADRALERDIDEKVQFWVDCIQTSAPGAAILPVASFSDYFGNEFENEAKRRCTMLKQRLLKHEERRIKGLKERYKQYVDQNRVDDPAAIRLRKLLCPYTRPKLIFGDNDDNSVVRVSGTQYTGFDVLTERIISIATGRYKFQRFPIFHGHVGARIPRMRLEVREEVRKMREKFKVVEWGHFVNKLRDRGLTSIEDISDALHFLTNTGELSYFGAVMTTKSSNPCDYEAFPKNDEMAYCDASSAEKDHRGLDRDDVNDVDEDQALLSMDDTSITAPVTEDGSLTTIEDYMSNGLSQFVFLNPRWLVAAVACILRHDLDREIKETRRQMISNDGQSVRNSSFYEAHLNCPVITDEDACMLWKSKRITKLAAKKAEEYSNDMTVTPFEFLQLLLIRFGVFVPIDLTIDKALLGGKEYSRNCETLCTDEPMLAPAPVEVITTGEYGGGPKSKFFFLPSLLGPCEPADAWTYKTTDSWKATLCHSILFPDGIPPGLMERLTANVLSSIYAATKSNDSSKKLSPKQQGLATCEGQMSVKEILCWRTAFYIKLGTLMTSSDGTKTESIVEIFTHLADRDSHLCVGADDMGVGMRRLITSGRGQVGDGGRKIWKGGYLLVCKCIQRVMEAYGGLEFEKQGFCPECLAKKSIGEASFWDQTAIRAAVRDSESTLRCHHGHRVDTRLVAGPVDSFLKTNNDLIVKTVDAVDTVVPIKDILPAVVVVGLWDGKTRKVVRVGSGFIVDKKRGLIVTASHTLINIWGDKNFPYGENYYGLPQGKVVIGVIPDKDSDESNGKDLAVFRYFAKIVSKDPSLDRGECHLDACVLRITTRLENDVGGNGDGCGDQPEILLLNNDKAMKKEQLQSLKVTEKCEIEEQVRIIGYNQGGEGLLGPGESLNRCVDFARGYVCMKFTHGNQDVGTVSVNGRRDRFKPREEVVVICPTIGGHSGGPCVNQQGEVIGILSRADPAESQRCYISPAHEWKGLVKEAKSKM